MESLTKASFITTRDQKPQRMETSEQLLLRKYEKLTPGGSEFANDPKAVYDYIAERMATVKELHKKIQQLESRLRSNFEDRTQD